MNANAVILVVCLCLGTSSALSLPSFSFLDGIQKTVEGISYQIGSTFGVVRTLCFSNKINITDELATEFFNCYDESTAAGRAIYTKCQIETGGVDAVMNTTAGIKKTCGSLYTFPLYARCLSKNFKAEGLDMGEAVTKVNQCEEKVLGLAQ